MKKIKGQNVAGTARAGYEHGSEERGMISEKMLEAARRHAKEAAKESIEILRATLLEEKK